MSYGGDGGGWWDRFKRFFLGQFGIGVRRKPSPQYSSGRGGSSFTSSSYTHSSNSYTHSRTTWDTSSDPVYAPSDTSAIDDLASSLDRRADRYENAGDAGRAAELHRAAENVRESSSYAQAREYAREADHPFINDAPVGADPQWSGNDFGQSSPEQTFANAGDFGTGFSDNS